jgi:hypothetical protein
MTMSLRPLRPSTRRRCSSPTLYLLLTYAKAAELEPAMEGKSTPSKVEPAVAKPEGQEEDDESEEGTVEMTAPAAKAPPL